MSKKRRTAAPHSASPAAVSARPHRPGRRILLLAAVGAGLCALTVFGWLWLRPPIDALTRTPDQNVLLITIDTLRADALGCYGGRAATPNLDRLASLGVRFDFAHAHVPLTLPAHASILTGLYPFQHGIHDNQGFRLPKSIPTVAAMLRQRGFRTGAFIGAFPLDSRFGLNEGFQVYDERYGKSASDTGFRMAERRAADVAAAAGAWIGQQRGRWFAWVHVFDPHAPYEPPPPYDREYAEQPYLGEVAYTDHALATVLDAARDPSGRPTLVIVTGDHGESLGEHGEMTHVLYAYEATLRVPLIVAQVNRSTKTWSVSKSMNAAGRVASAPAYHVDIVPTILDAISAVVPRALPGQSLVGALAETNRASYFEALSASLNRGWAPLRGVLVDREKYIDLPLTELYDLSHDPGEEANLSPQSAERVRALGNRLRAFGPTGPVQRRPEDADTAARLASLGYVAGRTPLKSHYTEDDDPKRLIALDRQMHDAVDMYEHGRPREAATVYQQVIAVRPMAVAYAQLAMLQWELGEPARAIATLRSAVQSGVADEEIRTKLGIYLAEDGQAAEAVRLLEAVTTGDTPDVDGLNALGIAYGQAGRSQDAARTFYRILAINPSNSMARENLGSIALGAGRYDEARRWFHEALQIDPTSAQAQNGMGVVELKAGNRQAAIEHWKASVARDPQNFDALYNVATELVNAGQPDAARPYLEQFARTAPPVFYARDIRTVQRMIAQLH